MPTTLRPADAHQLRDMVGFMVAAKSPVEILGAGSKRALGRPVQAEHRLEATALAGIELYEPDELVMSALAGTRLRHVEAALATHRQQLAFEPMDHAALFGGEPGEATIGGVLAANVSGPRRVKAGAARDHFLGVEAVSGRAEAFKAGGRVVKNVTGYDLCKLLAGSWGTLAVMRLVTFKVLPAPEDTQTVLVHGLDDARGVEVLGAALRSPHEVSGAALLPDGPAALRVEGFGPSVAARVAGLTTLLGRVGEIEAMPAAPSLALWREVRDAVPVAAPREHQVWRLSLPPAAAPGVVQAVRTRLPVRALYDWGGGLVWLAIPPQPDAGEPLVRAAVARTGGHATLVRADAPVRAAVAAFPPQPGPLAALGARVKDAFDPWRVLNPGRMQAGL